MESFFLGFNGKMESKSDDLSNFDFSKHWGNKAFGMEYVGSVGQSGGLICLWDSSIFDFNVVVKNRYFLRLSGVIKGSGKRINLINVYAPQGVAAKNVLWGLIEGELRSSSGLWAVMGDFNAVRFAEERKGSIFKNSCASNFNSFIHRTGVMEYGMKGSQFTCIRDNGRKLSKIDRVLVSSEFFNLWPDACLRALPSRFSDHCPLLLSSKVSSYGARPFRVFNSWLLLDGYEEVVRKAAMEFEFEGSPDTRLSRKLAFIRGRIKEWKTETDDKLHQEENLAVEEIDKLEQVMGYRNLNEEEEWVYVESKKVLKEAAVINDLEGMIRRFLWGGSSESSKIHWVAWDRVASPKSVGGLGICKLGVSNIALLSKWGWRFKEENNRLWVKVVEAMHNTGRCWDFIPTNNALRGVWNNIVKVLSRTVVDNMPLRRFFKGVVGDGVSVAFWLDPWVGNETLKEMCPNLFRLERNKKCKVNSRVGNGGGWSWYRMPASSSELEELDFLVNVVESVELNGRRDKWSWLGDKKGNFSVRSVRKMMYDAADYSSLYVLKWCKWIPAKCNVFMWQAVMSKIPTADALIRRNMAGVEGMCSVCEEGLESVEHLFTSCSVALMVWNLICKWTHVQRFFAFSFKDLIEMHDHVGLKGKAKVVFQGIIFISCWAIWRARNKLKFEGIKIKVEEVVSEIKSMGFLWVRSRLKMYSLSWSDWCKYEIM
ncbi:RNA-directed DNA polymerase, eukaryota [Artemisia annua]|uniref:RNA-directed DNA polymerase, eukaryota n=1 Tax=Artemisia annua TaxID=35608 RepID=A0A2U1P392_ARTAN|nr:RNA-directed DNA polymerase, eukaryota [Artemisia annua]